MRTPEPVVVVGASGFGRECLDVLDAMAAAGAHIHVVGVLDDGPTTTNLARLSDRGVPYLGTLDDWLDRPDGRCRYVLGIGRPSVRRALVRKLDSTGALPFTAVHPSATRGSGSLFGDGVVICAGAAISTNVNLGRHVHVNPNAAIGHDAVLGEFVSVNPAAVVSGEVHLGAETLVGANATILQQLTVGARTVVGAGAVVTKNVPSGVVVTGIPGAWK